MHLMDSEHDIDFKVPDIDAITLKSEFVRKVQES